MGIPGSANPLLLATAAAAGGYAIERSVRFNSSDSAYCSRVPSTAGNRRTWTWAGWVKRSGFGAQGMLMDNGNATSISTDFGFDTDNTIYWTNYNGGYQNRVRTLAVFRDSSAWYHVVFACDTTQATDTNRIKIYVNGTLQSLTSVNGYPTQNFDTYANSTSYGATVGARSGGSFGFNGYLADIHFIDGQALDPTSFGEFDDNGIWQPIDASGLTYGTNGFHLPFSDNSTTAALGTDTSGNGNDWTVNNLTASVPGSTTAYQNFNVLTYTGNGSTQTISGLQFSPDLVWIKSRNSGVESHTLADTVRGANKQLRSNETIAETSNTNELTAFNSDGFSVGNNGRTNENAYTYVAWCWNAGDTTVTNTTGSISSQVRANPSAGFSIVTYTGTGANATVGHGLGVAPSLLIIKNRDTARNWPVWFQGFSGTDYLYLNSTLQKETTTTFWNNTTPTSTVFSLGPGSTPNTSGDSHVAYCFAPVAGYSAFGNYTGNGSTSGPSVTTDFKPRWVMIKRTDSSDDWQIVDSARGGTQQLYPNLSSAETATSSRNITFNANGFTISGDNAGINASGGTYIYAAFAGIPAGEQVDSLIDVPTNGTETDTGTGGEVRGNYATLNPLQNANGDTFSNGNLDISTNSSSYGTHTSTIATPLSGKWYAEATINSSSGYTQIGLAYSASTFTTSSYLGSLNGVAYRGDNGNKMVDGSLSSYGATFGTGAVIGIAYDADAGTVTFYKNGSSQGSISLTVRSYYFAGSDYNSSGTDSLSWNFGQRPFAYTAPSGFKALNTANLGDPVVTKPSEYMDVKLWTGNGSTQTISGLEFSPDLLWIKGRSAAYDHYVQDAIRGSTVTLETNNTGAETTNSDGVTAFTSDGFSLGAGTGFTAPNVNGVTYVGWTWDAGSSTVSNTDGSITSSVRANPSAGFSIVGYVGTQAQATVGHGLGVAPAMIIAKCRGTSDSEWAVYHQSLASGDILRLNNTVAAVSSTNTWDSTAGGPTSTVFRVNNSTWSNASGQNMIAYCFAPVAGYSSFGSYTGNGSTDGVFVYTGFRPKYLMVKSPTSVIDWIVEDSSRSPYNQMYHRLYPNDSVAESTSTNGNMDFLSNGFKLRNAHAAMNASGQTYIYAAFAEHPFQYARAR